VIGSRSSRALAALAVGSVLLYLSQKQAQSQSDAHSLSARAAALPELGLVPADATQITKIELVLPVAGDSPAQHVTLERRASGWRLTAPIESAASNTKVEALLENISQLKVSDRIDSGTSNYERYGLTEAAAVHITAWRGPDKVSDLYFGKSSARGQLLRLASSPGALAIQASGPGGYSGFLYTRALRAWREPAIFQFDPSAAVTVQIENPSGRFAFERTERGWLGSHSARRADGTLQAAEKSWNRFDASRVDALLDAFKSLSADEFGSEADRANAGLEHAERTGGVLRIELANPVRELVVRVGNAAHGPSDWAIKDSRWAVQAGGDGTLYALALWTCAWVTNGAAQFEFSHARDFSAAR
jgi:hypothetical protein